MEETMLDLNTMKQFVIHPLSESGKLVRAAEGELELALDKFAAMLQNESQKAVADALAAKGAAEAELDRVKAELEARLATAEAELAEAKGKLEKIAEEA